MNTYTLAETHLDLIARQCNSLMRKNFGNHLIEANDLTDAGTLALLEACDHFDASKGIPFEHYAARTIRHAMIKQLTHPYQKHVSLPEDYQNLENPCCNWDTEEALTLEILKDALDKLPTDERSLIESRFGFTGEPLKLRELGAIMNISLQAVDKKLKRIIAKLRQYINTEY